MKSELDFLSEISVDISDVLWNEPELAKKQELLEAVSTKISERIGDLLPPGTVLMAGPTP